MSEYYTVEDDFGGVEPNLEQLDYEIIQYIDENPGNITPTYDGITQYINETDIAEFPFIAVGKTIVKVMFLSSLSGPEKSFLDTIISNHIPSTEVPTNNYSTLILTNSGRTQSSSYIRVNKPFTFPGISYGRACIISRMDPGITSYDIRIFDRTNRVTLIDANLSNTDESLEVLGEMVGVSNQPWIIEVHCKKNGGDINSKVYLESIDIHYNV